MYKVLRYFTDLQDKNYPYKAGDAFPRKGLDVNAERLKELSTAKNRRGVPVIEEIKEEAEQPKAEKPKAAKPRNSKKRG